MKAAVLHEIGGPLSLDDVPEPEATEGRSVVDVRAAGINFADVLIHAGRYPQPPPLPAQAASAPRLRVVVSNLFVLNPDPSEAGRALRRLDADVVVVPELDARGLAGLRRSGLLKVKQGLTSLEEVLGCTNE